MKLKLHIANELHKSLEKTKSQQGLIGKSWNGIKNLFGAKTGSNKTAETINKLKNGQISVLEAQKALNNFQAGQLQVVDVVADIASAIGAGIMYSIALGGAVAASFTGGASLGLTALAIGSASLVGAATKTAIKYADAKVGGREYSGKDAGKDALSGAINGPLAFLTAGVGCLVTNMLAKAGLKSAQVAATTMSNQIVVGFGKSTTREVILKSTEYLAHKGIGTIPLNNALTASNSAYQKTGAAIFRHTKPEALKSLTAAVRNSSISPANRSLLPGTKTFGSKLTYNTLSGIGSGATYGAFSSASNYAIETSFGEGEFSAMELLNRSSQGATGGAIGGGIFSAGLTTLFTVAPKGYHFIKKLIPHKSNGRVGSPTIKPESVIDNKICYELVTPKM